MTEDHEVLCSIHRSRIFFFLKFYIITMDMHKEIYLHRSHLMEANQTQCSCHK